jgi:hypothetical protein
LRKVGQNAHGSVFFADQRPALASWLPATSFSVLLIESLMAIETRDEKTTQYLAGLSQPDPLPEHLQKPPELRTQPIEDMRRLYGMAVGAIMASLAVIALALWWLL